MNLISQAIKHPVIKDRIRISFQLIPASRTKIRLSKDRSVLNKRLAPLDKFIFKIKNTSFNMILCPAGQFISGIYDPDNMNPKRENISKPYLLGETEVTQEMYQAVMLKNPSSFVDLKRPVNNVSWYDALVFCNKLSEIQGKKPYYILSNIETYASDHTKIKSCIAKQDLKSNGFRLPLELEWEYAAKAGTNNKYAGCDEDTLLVEYARFKGNVKNGRPCRIKTRKSNEWGFYDMTGNVWEWTWSLKKPFFTGKIIRGGGFEESAGFDLRTDYRRDQSPDTTKESIGFRLAMTVIN